jgi:PAS domain S-box-containing protein
MSFNFFQYYTMTFTSITLVIIFFGALSISFLLSCLHKEKKKSSPSPLVSSNTDDIFLIQDTCFQSPHEAIALFDDSGLLILSNNLFKKQFPKPADLDHQAGIYDFFPEKMWLMLQNGLSSSQLDSSEVQQEFSIEDKHFIFTFSPAPKGADEQARIFLFCKELSAPPQPHRCVSPDDVIWKTILKLTNPSALHSDWHSCFNQVLPDICEALEADELFLLDNSPPAGTPLSNHGKNQSSGCNHDWILSVPVWMNLLGKGKTIQNFAENFDREEQILLQQEGIKTLLLIPLIVGNELLGLIGLTRNHKRLFHQQQVNSLLFIANILTMAIGNQQDRSERDRLVTVVEQSSDCIIIINTSGSVLYANPACEEVTGFPPQEIVGNSIKRLYTPSIRKKLWYKLKDALATGEAWSGQFDNYRKDKTLYQEEMLLSPVYDQEGRVANQVIVKRDITEDKRLEAIAEAANLMDNIGFIFSSIRHELGNPINSIKVSLSVLESNLETYDTEAITRFIRRSLSDIGRVEYLLKTLRNFSIFERPDIKETDMRTLLDKLIQLTEKDLAKQYIMLATHHPAQSLTGMIDPRAFLQVLLNLTTNAVAALDENDNKKITISMVQKQKNQITFIFEDNGCGMEKETVRNLFRPFFTTKPEGTGLGLVIVKKMLSKMNCSITASSRKGKGTRMEIIIPAA